MELATVALDPAHCVPAKPDSLTMLLSRVSAGDKEAFNLPEAKGALVNDVTPDKPAAKAGIKHGDVIVAVDGRPINNNRQLIDYIPGAGHRMRFTARTIASHRLVCSASCFRPAGVSR